MKLNKILVDVESALLKCLFYYFRAWGIAPIDLKIVIVDNKIRRLLFSPSYTGIAYSLLFCLGTTAWFYLAIYYNAIKYGWLGTIFTVQNNCMIIHNACIIFFLSIEHKKGITLLNRINNFIERMTRANSNKELQKKLKRRLIILVVIYTLPLAACHILGYLYFNSVLYFLANSLYYMPNVLMLQYCLLLKLIDNLLVLMNDSCHMTTSNSISLMFVSRQTEFKQHLAQTWDSCAILSEIIYDLSRYYTFPIFVSISFQLYLIITEVYTVTIILYYLTLGSYFDYFFYTYRAFINLYHVLMLTMCASSIIDQREKTRKIINNYLKNISGHHVIAGKVKNQHLCFTATQSLSRFYVAKLFSSSHGFLCIFIALQDKLKFSIYKLFSLDINFMVKIVDIITTYLVILVQFQPKELAIKVDVPHTEASPLPINLSTT